MVSDSERELREAVAGLPGSVSTAMTFALRSGWFTVRPCGYESDAGVCPFAAAAPVAGVWRDGHAAAGGPDWGDETTPNPRCFEFAVCFDVYSMEAGVDRAVQVVRGELGIGQIHRRLVA